MSAQLHLPCLDVSMSDQRHSAYACQNPPEVSWVAKPPQAIAVGHRGNTSSCSQARMDGNTLNDLSTTTSVYFRSWDDRYLGTQGLIYVPHDV